MKFPSLLNNYTPQCTVHMECIHLAVYMECTLVRSAYISCNTVHVECTHLYTARVNFQCTVHISIIITHTQCRGSALSAFGMHSWCTVCTYNIISLIHSAYGVHSLIYSQCIWSALSVRSAYISLIHSVYGVHLLFAALPRNSATTSALIHHTSWLYIWLSMPHRLTGCPICQCVWYLRMYCYRMVLISASCVVFRSPSHWPRPFHTFYLTTT